jgi:hypothetical protein
MQSILRNIILEKIFLYAGLIRHATYTLF